MSPSKVQSILGPPQRTIRRDGQLRWMVYGTSAQRLLIYFRHEKVVAVPQRGDQPPGRLSTSST